MPASRKALIATAATIVSLPILGWAASEAVVIYEMQAVGALSRAELGDDFGLGILLFFFVPPATLAGAIIVWLSTWHFLRRREAKSNSHKGQRHA